jgi:proline iminopeptidase
MNTMREALRRVLVTFLVAFAACPLAAQRYPEAEEEGHFTGADGVRLFYRKLGQGKDVTVVLHGGPGGMIANGEEMAPLAKTRTLILYDQRGGGRSQLLSDPKPLTANHHVRDLEALRQHFRLEQVSRLGISWGSALAALLLIPDAGHEFWAEKPNEFVAAADRFLRGEYPKDSEVVRLGRP